MRGIVAAISLAAVSLGACGVPTQLTAHVAPDKDVPSGLLNAAPPTTTTIPSQSPTTGVTICLTQLSGPLKAVTEQLRARPTLNDVLKQLSTSPTRQEQALGLGTSVTSGITATVAGGIAKVELTSDFATASTADQLLAVGQIVCTLTAQPGIGQVLFELKGVTADVPRGDGSTTSAPVSRDDYRLLIPHSTP